MAVCDESKPYIFISYSHKDTAKVMKIMNRLKQEGFNVWFDGGIDPGTEWDENIASHVQRCDYFIAFISKGYLASKNCKDELNYSRDLDKDQLLVYLEDVELPGGMAMRMNRIQAIYWNSYDAKNIEEAYEKLFSAKGIEKTRLAMEKSVANIDNIPDNNSYQNNNFVKSTPAWLMPVCITVSIVAVAVVVLVLILSKGSSSGDTNKDTDGIASTLTSPAESGIASTSTTESGSAQSSTTGSSVADPTSDKKTESVSDETKTEENVDPMSFENQKKDEDGNVIFGWNGGSKPSSYQPQDGWEEESIYNIDITYNPDKKLKEEFSSAFNATKDYVHKDKKAGYQSTYSFVTKHSTPFGMARIYKKTTVYTNSDNEISFVSISYQAITGINGKQVKYITLSDISKNTISSSTSTIGELKMEATIDNGKEINAAYDPKGTILKSFESSIDKLFK